MVRVRSLEKIEIRSTRPLESRIGCMIERSHASWPLPRSNRTVPLKCSLRVIAVLNRR